MNIVSGLMQTRLYPVWFMLVITVVFMSAVSGAHLLTQDTVQRNQALFFKRAVLQAAGLTVPSLNKDVEDVYHARVRPLDGTNQTGRFAVHDETNRAVEAFVFRAAGPGLWGVIEAMIGYRAEDGALTGIAFTVQTETPGLGARIIEPWFIHQFQGRQGVLKLVPEGTRSSVAGEIDAITGASITSRAVRDMVNRTTIKAEKILQGHQTVPDGGGA